MSDFNVVPKDINMVDLRRPCAEVKIFVYAE